MAAECRYADTGVGAAIAPGNQKWNGACADFVSAPSRISVTAAVIPVTWSKSVIPAICEIFHTPVCVPKRMIPTSIASPPNVVTSNACVAALRDDALSP